MGSYVDEVRQSLEEQLPGLAADKELHDLYALLAFVKGQAVTLEDVHDAWAIWRSRIAPQHRFLIPFNQLAPEVQELDQKYADAIGAAAQQREA